MITADYVPEGDGYSVLCKIRESDFSLLEVKIAAGTKTMHEIYAKIGLNHHMKYTWKYLRL